MRTKKTTPTRPRKSKGFKLQGLSSLRKKDALAILCSDLHITDKVPVARAEKNWLEVMAGYFQQLQDLQDLLDTPVIVAGDIFDKPNPSPEVINFALRNLPTGPLFAVPGQHDLLHHNYADLEKTAYSTLCQAKWMTNLLPERPPVITRGVILYGVPWGYEIPKHQDTLYKSWIHLAVVHKYIWQKGCSDYDQAPKTSTIKNLLPSLKGYTAAVFGDNHRGFYAPGKVNVFNGGCFIRRRGTERPYKPHVGVLLKDGTIHQIFLDTRRDQWASEHDIMCKAAEVNLPSLEHFLDEIKDIGSSASLDFTHEVKRAIASSAVSSFVRDLIYQAMESKQ